MSPLDDDLLAEIRKDLDGRKVHATQVSGVDFRRGEDAEGNPALFVHLTLAQPPEGSETWPADDVSQLRRLVREAVIKMVEESPLRWYVSFESATAEIAPE